jgi:hypothetical protein
MIQVPPGFDVTSLFTDYIHFAAPFVPVALLFAAYRYLTRGVNHIGR